MAGATAVFEDADDFQARLCRFGARSPGILPFWACCRLLLGQRTLQLHGNSFFTGVMGPGDVYPRAALIVCGRLQKH